MAAAVFAAPARYAELSRQTQAEIESDWLVQAEKQKDFAAACRDEAARLKRVLSRLKKSGKDCSEFEKSLADIEKTADGREKYLALRVVKRDAMFSSLSFDKILVVDSPFPEGPEASHESRVKTENTATYGARLQTVDLSSPDYKAKDLISGGDKAIARASLNFSGDEIVLSMREKSSTNYNLYKIKTDGSGLTRLTFGGYNDCDPTWLPDGNIVFSTSRSNHYIRCAGSGFRGTVLARCDADGKNIYFISSNNEADFMPSILDDGRIIYCRWEYVDKNIFRLQSIWTVNPDGTNPQVYWGGQSHWPDLKIGAVQIPGTEKCIFTPAGHHNVFNGGLAIIDIREGMNFPKGIYNLTPHLHWTEATIYSPNAPDLPYNKDFSMTKALNAFYSPMPIDSDLYVVSARKQKCGQWKIDGEHFALYIADYDGNIEFLKRGKYNLFYGQPVMSKKVPRIIPSMIEPLGDKKKGQEAPNGVLYSANIYENSGIPFGAGKYLRVIEHCSPTYQDGLRNSSAERKAVYKKLGLKLSDLFTKNGVREYCFLSGETTMSILTDESHKRILGEVPIESDGSVHFEVPAMKAVYFQIIDKDRKVLQTMRSSTHAMSGEFRGCLGCHATKIARAPQTRPAKALRKPPRKLVKPFNDITFGFEKYIQPILDKHCVSCHNGSNKDNRLDLRGTRLTDGAPFSTSYINLVMGVDRTPAKDKLIVNSIANPISCYYDYPSLETDTPEQESVIAPMSVLTYNSKLVKVIESGHNGVKLSDEEFNRIKAWIDLNCPFYGEEDVLDTPDIDEEYFNNNPYIMFRGLSYPPKMKGCPDVDRAFRQDKFSTQADRLPKDAAGKVLPAIKYENEKRTVVE